MKRTIPWTAWVAATIILWIVWIWGVFGQIQDGITKLRAESMESRTRETHTLQLLANAPVIMAQIDSLSNEYRRAVADFVSADNLQFLPEELTDSGRRCGVPQTEVTLNLASVLALAPSPASETRMLDTVQVQLAAQGEFATLGGWLDEVEERADFLLWTSCRWEPAPTDGLTRFSGTAQFRVIAAGGKSVLSQGE